ncbi:hypothetical protein P2318_10365 [Myxococcaceae bacterium GXIMD 01537]
MAQQNGPFANTTALVTYWTGQSTGGSTAQIYVNGKKVYERLGFGPAFVKQYFNCADGSGIKAVCNNIFDGHLDVSTAVATFPNWLTVYVDGTLYRSGDPYHSAHIKKCYGDTSYYGAVKYYIVESMNDGWSPPYPGNSCF